MFEQRRRVQQGSDLTVGRTPEVRSLQLSRKGRSADLLRTVAALDTTVDPAQRHALARWVEDQYQADYGCVPLGFVSRCYLGPPYVDHYLNLLGEIVEHFAASQPMPPPYDGARMLARTGAYSFVEVHSDGTLVPVKGDGTVVYGTTG